MYRAFLQQQRLIVVETTEREFRQKYPGPYELIQAIADYDNLEKVIERLVKDYKAIDVVRDYQTHTRWGTKYFTPEVRQRWIEGLIRGHTGKPRPLYSNKKTSATMRGKSNFEGHKHNTMTKIIIATKRHGKKTISEGQRWCHHPETGQEFRKSALPEGFKWGRSPEFKDYINTGEARKIPTSNPPKINDAIDRLLNSTPVTEDVE